MKRHIASIASTLIFTGALSIVATATLAAESNETTLTTQARQTDSLTSTRGAAVVSDRISSEFSGFAGSTANSDALVAGLRNGTAITLTTTDAKGATTSTTFTPSTGKMGYGNVFISLALAKQQLASLGITQPTAQQLQAALAGGTVTTSTGKTATLTGVLQLRSQGMGWGQIANSLGFKLGPVISGIKAANAQVTAQPAVKTGSSTTVTAAGGNAATRSESGIVTGAGGHVGASGADAANMGRGNAYGRGIVTGTGAAAGQASVGGAAQGRAVGKGN